MPNYDNQGRLKVSAPLTQVQPLTHMSVSRTNAQSISTITLTPIAWDTVNWDTLSEYDGTDTWTATYAGFYRVRASCLLGDSTAWNSYAEIVYLQMSVNGVLARVADREQPNKDGVSAYISLRCNETLYLNAGDTVTISIYQSSGASINIYASDYYNHFNVDRLPDKLVGSGPLVQTMELAGAYSAPSDVATISIDVGQPYQSVIVTGALRSNRAATADYVDMRFNGSTSGYWYTAQYSEGTTVAAQGGASLGYTRAAYVSGDTAPSGSYGTMWLEIPNASSSSIIKACISQSSVLFATDGVPDQYVFNYSSVWNNTAAINNLLFYPEVGTAWKAGTNVQVYGVY